MSKWIYRRPPEGGIEGRTVDDVVAHKVAREWSEAQEEPVLLCPGENQREEFVYIHGKQWWEIHAHGWEVTLEHLEGIGGYLGPYIPEEDITVVMACGISPIGTVEEVQKRSGYKGKVEDWPYKPAAAGTALGLANQLPHPSRNKAGKPVKRKRIPVETEQLLELLELHASLLHDYVELAKAGDSRYYGEIACKLRLLIIDSGRNKALIFKLQDEANLDFSQLKEDLAGQDLFVRVDEGKRQLSLSPEDLILKWAQQQGAAHVDHSLDEDLFLAHKHGNGDPEKLLLAIAETAVATATYLQEALRQPVPTGEPRMVRFGDVSTDDPHYKRLTRRPAGDESG